MWVGEECVFCCCWMEYFLSWLTLWYYYVICMLSGKYIYLQLKVKVKSFQWIFMWHSTHVQNRMHRFPNELLPTGRATGPPAFREHMFLMLYANRSPDDRKKWSLEETFSVPVQIWALSWGDATLLWQGRQLWVYPVVLMSHATDSALLTFTWQNGSMWLKMVFPVAWISIQA